jgi:sugar O-acyltransferase (sialic acid O-acetyltransferase NeuD family)
VRRIVIVGASQILSDLVDCALECGDDVVRLLVDETPETDPRDVPLAQRLQQWAGHGVRPCVQALAEYEPASGDVLILGPTTPHRHRLAARIDRRWPGVEWGTLVHPRAQVSRLATLSPGCFVGACAVIGPGARLEAHVFVNRSASIGHDTKLGAYARVQPGATIGGLVDVGRGCTVGIGATVVERLRLGDGSFVAAGAVVLGDVPALTLVAGVPAQPRKTLPAIFDD